MEDDERLSEASFGSVISLQSFDDSVSIQERHKNVKRKTRRDQSPYSVRPSSESTQGKNLGKNTGHNAWSTAIRNGYPGLSSESFSNKWAHSRGTLKKQVSNYDKGGNKSQNGAFSRDEHILASGKPAYKSPEDYYDEVMELRQVIKELKVDNGVLKTKLQRITQENVLKDRQIKDFLNPNKQPDEIRRTLTDRKADSSAVVSSLKQKLHLMERNVKDKENELRKLKSDLKSTNIEELRIQLETYYQETQRLQSVLSSVYSQAPGTRTISESRSMTSNTSSRLNSPCRENVGGVDQERVEKILDDNRRLESENKGLKKDLLSAMEPRNNKNMKNKNVDYADMNRLQMLRKIGELEQLLDDANTNTKNSSKKDKKGDNESKSSERGKNEPEELDKQRLTIENLKRDRSHYREEAEKLRSALREAHEEIEQLRDDLKKTKEQRLSEDKASPPRPLPRTRSKTGVLKKSISFQTLDTKPKLKKDQAARTLQKHWRRYNDQKAASQDKDHSMAVIQIQSILRGHSMRKRRIGELSESRDEEVDGGELEWEDAVTRIQSALRAHHSRRKYLPNRDSSKNGKNHRYDHSDVSNDEERGQRRKPSWERRSFNKSGQQSSVEEKSSASRRFNKFMDEQEDEDDNDDDDDDVVIGGSRPNLRELGKQSRKTHGEPTARKTTAGNAERQLSGKARRFKDVSPEDSEDDVEIPSRFRNSSPASKDARNQNGFSFARSDSEKKGEIEEKKSSFFGRETRQLVDHKQKQEGLDNSSLDNLFSPSRSVKRPFDRRSGNEEESEEDVVTNSKKTNGITENSEKKGFFSWGGSKTKKSQDTSTSPRKQKPSKKDKEKNENPKPSSVWSSRPSETLDDDDDEDDDVVVTPKIARRNQTKTASLLDELF